ncbi:MAG TPA: carboxypeptidase [Lentisphaeria bacterium]|nr:MAG: carboxypeptidase [Lentisphaerae bacterium GWF2_38_69]HBM15887.1 carboxypeptidase [Lentisphaeria bacterium]
MNETRLIKLKGLINEINDINMAAAVLGWDQETYMPAGGINDRADQLSTLSKISHEKFTSKEIGDLIGELKTEITNINDETDDVRLIKLLDKIYSKSIKVPSSLVSEMSKAASLGQQAWAEAKKSSDFSKFKPGLKKIVELKKEYAKIFLPYDSIYDPLLDDFEPGLKTADIKAIFDELKPQQVALIRKISEKDEIDNSFLFKEYDETKQWSIGEKAITSFGYDWTRGRQDKSTHPFSTNFGIDDVRITTRVMKNYLPAALFGSMHESGHAMYEQGINRSLRRTPLARGASLAIHESQSRLWENIVGRSKAFWKYFYRELQNTFPENLSDVSLETFYKGINKVKPSLIRVEADEATYNLHVMLRLEIEIALMQGAIHAADLPEIWNSKMEDYLGIKPQKDSDGVLQDIHWSMGAIGYFPTYALGNLVSAQLWECALRDITDLELQIEKGEFSMLLNWLRKNIHSHGSKFEPQELVEKVTGSKINPSAYTGYLNKKYSEVYGL